MSSENEEFINLMPYNFSLYFTYAWVICVGAVLLLPFSRFTMIGRFRANKARKDKAAIEAQLSDHLAANTNLEDDVEDGLSPDENGRPRRGSIQNMYGPKRPRPHLERMGSSKYLLNLGSHNSQNLGGTIPETGSVIPENSDEKKPTCGYMRAHFQGLETWFAERGSITPWSLTFYTFVLLAFLDGVRLETVNGFPPVNDAIAYLAPIARGAGRALNICIMGVMLLMCRIPLSWLAQTRLALILPLNQTYDAHMYLGWISLALITVHGVGQTVRFILDPAAFERGSASVDTIGNPVTSNKDIRDAIFGGTGVFITGWIMTLIFLLMAFTRGKLADRLGIDYQCFIRTHMLWFPFTILLFLHGVQRGVPETWKFISVPMLGLIIHYIYLHFFSGGGPTILVPSTAVRSSGVIRLVMMRPAQFVFRPGQYAQLAVPDLGNEYHPFTIASAPMERTIEFFIEPVGDWTKKLQTLIRERQDTLADNPLNVIVRGPYGAPSEFAFQFDQVVLVAGGVGATPFLSVLKDIVWRAKLTDYVERETTALFSDLTTEELNKGEKSMLRLAEKRRLEHETEIRVDEQDEDPDVGANDVIVRALCCGINAHAALNTFTLNIFLLFLLMANWLTLQVLQNADEDEFQFVIESETKFDDFVIQSFAFIAIISALFVGLIVLIDILTKARVYGIRGYCTSTWHLLELVTSIPVVYLIVYKAILGAVGLAELQEEQGITNPGLGDILFSFAEVVSQRITLSTAIDIMFPLVFISRLLAFIRIMGGRRVHPEGGSYAISRRPTKKVQAFMVMKKFKASNWLIQEFTKIENAAKNSDLEIDVFVFFTRDDKKPNPADWKLKNSCRLGRPDWKQQVFKPVVQQHFRTYDHRKEDGFADHIGVFFCGNHRLGAAVRSAAMESRSPGDPANNVTPLRFVWFREAFG